MSSDPFAETPRRRFFAKLEVFYKFTDELSNLSCCKRMSVAAIVLPPDFSEVLAIGYNGPPAGMPNNACNGGDPCGCLHAEANAITKLDSRSLHGLILLCTHPPCWRCAGAIINKRAIGRVLTWRDHVNNKGIDNLKLVGIDVLSYHELLRHSNPKTWWEGK